MNKADFSHRRLVVEILTASFDLNRSVNYVVRQDKHRVKRIHVLMEYAFDTCLAFGEVYLSDDQHACALILYPEKRKTSFRSIFYDLRLLTGCIGLNGIGKVLDREKRIKRHHPKMPMMHLWFIGVKPVKQGAGIGSDLLKEIIQHSNSKQRPVYLETSTPENISWYKKQGFEVIAELELGYALYCLSRKNSTN